MLTRTNSSFSAPDSAGLGVPSGIPPSGTPPSGSDAGATGAAASASGRPPPLENGARELELLAAHRVLRRDARAHRRREPPPTPRARRPPPRARCRRRRRGHRRGGEAPVPIMRRRTCAQLALGRNGATDGGGIASCEWLRSPGRRRQAEGRLGGAPAAIGTARRDGGEAPSAPLARASSRASTAAGGLCASGAGCSSAATTEATPKGRPRRRAAPPRARRRLTRRHHRRRAPATRRRRRRRATTRAAATSSSAVASVIIAFVARPDATRAGGAARARTASGGRRASWTAPSWRSTSRGARRGPAQARSARTCATADADEAAASAVPSRAPRACPTRPRTASKSVSVAAERPHVEQPLAVRHLLDQPHHVHGDGGLPPPARRSAVVLARRPARLRPPAPRTGRGGRARRRRKLPRPTPRARRFRGRRGGAVRAWRANEAGTMQMRPHAAKALPCPSRELVTSLLHRAVEIARGDTDEVGWLSGAAWPGGFFSPVTAV